MREVRQAGGLVFVMTLEAVFGYLVGAAGIWPASSEHRFLLPGAI